MTEDESIASAETVKTIGNEDQKVKSELRETIEVSSVSVTSQEGVSVDETTAADQKPSEEQKGKDSVYHSDYRFGLRMRVQYRINEEAIRCLLLVRWVGWVGQKLVYGSVGSFVSVPEKICCFV